MGNIGSYNITLDDKGRLMIPIAFRKQLGNELIISLEFEGTIVLRKKADFQKWASLLLEMSYLNKNSRLLQRKILGNSSEIFIDKKGRILIPKSLLDLSKITNNLYIIGTGDKVEIIDKSKWEELMSPDEEFSIENAAQALEHLDKKKKEENEA